MVTDLNTLEAFGSFKAACDEYLDDYWEERMGAYQFAMLVALSDDEDGPEDDLYVLDC